jgi:hypothetical protein
MFLEALVAADINLTVFRERHLLVRLHGEVSYETATRKYLQFAIYVK